MRRGMPSNGVTEPKLLRLLRVEGGIFFGAQQKPDHYLLSLALLNRSDDAYQTARHLASVFEISDVCG